MIRSAVRLPIPGTVRSRSASPAASTATSSSGGVADSTASATFGPTAWTVSSIRNSSRSCSLWKPYRVSVSSREIRWVCSVTVSPREGTFRSVWAETAAR